MDENPVSQRILISGSSGLVGTALQPFLQKSGYSIVKLVRNKKEESQDTILWEPEAEHIDLNAIEGFDAVINLAGENIASGRWNDQKKQRILESRVKSTETLSRALSKLKRPPKVFISTSAIGYYGDRGDTLCTEETTNGSGFLADVCRQWEAATQPASRAGIRTAILRLGIVLSQKGGVLEKMLIPFQMGLGGVLGSGDQYVSWISIDDLLAIILFVINTQSLSGPINVVSLHPVTNRQLTKTLGQVLNRPTILPAPAFVLQLLLGKEMANELLLNSTRAEPLRLLAAGYHFIHPNLDECLKSLLDPKLLIQIW